MCTWPTLRRPIARQRISLLPKTDPCDLPRPARRPFPASKSPVLALETTKTIRLASHAQLRPVCGVRGLRGVSGVSGVCRITPSLLPSQPLDFQFLRSRSGVFATQRLVALPVFHCSLILHAVRYD